MSQSLKKSKLPCEILGKSTQQLTLLHFRKESLLLNSSNNDIEKFQVLLLENEMPIKSLPLLFLQITFLKIRLRKMKIV